MRPSTLMLRAVKPFCLFILLLSATSGKAQTAFIKDPEGFVNVRGGKGTNAKIIDTLSNGRTVYCINELNEGEWVHIDYNRGDNQVPGYVHRSGISFLKDLSKFKRTIRDSTATFSLDSLQIVLVERKFNKAGRNIRYEKPKEGEKYVKSIDGAFPWGTDGELPKFEYRSFQLRITDSLHRIDRKYYFDVFEPNLEMTSAWLDRSTGRIYLEAMNSDGAGGYLVVWTIENGSILSRETLIPF